MYGSSSRTEDKVSFKNIYFYGHMCVPECIVYAPHMFRSPWRSEEASDPLEMEPQIVWNCRYWRLNLGPLKEQ